ncbi:MAG: MBOAT family protein, partial [Spirochaetaceae bacterium]|nr:MBOAT family protein [Spirochaetaceae bacterium]
MIFNSLQFLLFFPVVAAGYFALTMRLGLRRPALANILAQLFLLAASLFFYACWNPAYLALIIISVAVTWTSGLLMEERSAARKRLILAASLAINLAILFFFKYYGFFSGTAQLLTGGSVRFPVFNVLLPVG